MVAGTNGVDEASNGIGAPHKDHICVAVRFRPLSDKERARGDREVWTCQGNTVGVVDEVFDGKFAYDHVFPGSFSNEGVYETIASSIVSSALDGINGTIFAYGVTSSGKTFTMMGDDECPGIVPHAIAHVYHLIGTLSQRKEFALRLSMLEIYNEVVNDLLNPANTNLRLREDPRRGVYVEGGTEERLRSSDHALMVVAQGNENRKTSATAFNEGSSRSHTIIRLSIEANERAEYAAGSSTTNGLVGRTHSYLTMVDLAGSESARAEITKSHRVEGSFINKSLLTLGTVIHKLAEGGAAHIPFRDSKLTRILSNSLTGNGARVAVICTITPTSAQAEETHNTLKFASRAKKIAIEAKRNEILDQSSLIARYQQELSLLRHQLDVLMRERGTGAAPDPMHPEVRTLREKYEEEHAAVVRLEMDKEGLTNRAETLFQCVLDSNMALTIAERRLRENGWASPDDAADEMAALRQQVTTLASELRDQDRIIRSLTETGEPDGMENDMAMDVMLAEREYMQLQVEDLEARGERLAAALERMRGMLAASKGVDPEEINVEEILNEHHTSEGIAESNGNAVQRASSAKAVVRGGRCDVALQERVMMMEDKLTAFFIALKKRDEQLRKKEEVQRTLNGLHERVHQQLSDVTAENQNLKRELERLERRNEQLLGYDIDGLDQRDLNALIKVLTEAVIRVRTSVQLKKVQLRDLKAKGLDLTALHSTDLSGMTNKDIAQALASLREYGAERRALAEERRKAVEA